MKLNTLNGLYFCEVVTTPSALVKCFICTSLMAFTLSALYLGFYIPVLSPLEGRIRPSLILSLLLRHHVGFYFLCRILTLQIFVE